MRETKSGTDPAMYSATATVVSLADAMSTDFKKSSKGRTSCVRKRTRVPVVRTAVQETETGVSRKWEPVSLFPIAISDNIIFVTEAGGHFLKGSFLKRIFPPSASSSGEDT